MALFTMPNVHRMTVLKTERTAKNSQNRDFRLVKSSNSRPLIGREGHQNKSKGLTLIQKSTFGIVHNAICAMSVRPTVVGDAQMALSAMPNMQCV